MPSPYSSKNIVKVLLKHGFVLISQRGSHAKFRKSDKTVIVPMAKKEIPRGTFQSIIRQYGLAKNNFEK